MKTYSTPAPLLAVSNQTSARPFVVRLRSAHYTALHPQTTSGMVVVVGYSCASQTAYNFYWHFRIKFQTITLCMHKWTICTLITEIPLDLMDNGSIFLLTQSNNIWCYLTYQNHESETPMLLCAFLNYILKRKSVCPSICYFFILPISFDRKSRCWNTFSTKTSFQKKNCNRNAFQTKIKQLWQVNITLD